MKNIWYISKYAGLPYVRVTSRAFFILKALNKLGYESILITSDANHQTMPPNFKGKFYRHAVDNLPIIWLKTIKFSRSESILRIISWFHFEWQVITLNKSNLKKPDIIIVSSLSLLTILSGIFFKWRYKAKLIIEIRDIWPLTIIEEGNYSSNNPAVKLLAWVERLGYQNADAIIGTMPNLGKHVNQVLKQVKENVYCIPQGFDASAADRFEPLNKEFVQAHIPKNKFVVCYAGTIGLTNSLDKMIESAKVLEQKNQKIHFLIVGEGDDRNRLIEASEKLENVTVAPPIPNTQVHDLLSNYTDVVFLAVMKSKIWEYGQSLNKIVDYMQSGKPIIAAYAGFPSMINEARCGSFIDPDDTDALAEKIEYLANLSDAEKSSGKRGNAWIKKNRNFEKLGRDLADIIKNIT